MGPNWLVILKSRISLQGSSYEILLFMPNLKLDIGLESDNKRDIKKMTNYEVTYT